MQFQKGDEVHFIFDGLLPSLHTGTVEAVFRGTNKYRVGQLGLIPAALVFPGTSEGLRAARMAFRDRLIEVRNYEQRRIDEINAELRVLEMLGVEVRA